MAQHGAAGKGYYRLVLRAPELADAALPGQFVMLRVSDNLDPILARPFGISAVIAKKSIELYYRIVGRGTSMLSGVEAGRLLRVLGPIGNGFPAPAKETVPVLIAGGSGFPPFLFFSTYFRTVSPIVVIGARSRSCLPPYAAISRFKDRAKKVYIATDDGSAGRKGLVTDMLSSVFASTKEQGRFVFYACGPRGMMAAAAAFAERHGIPCHVSMEERMACGLGVCMGCSVAAASGGYKRVCKEGPVFDSREIDWSEQMLLKLRK